MQEVMKHYYPKPILSYSLNEYFGFEGNLEELTDKEFKSFMISFYTDILDKKTEESNKIIRKMKKLQEVIIRHTHATLLMEAGANIKDIQKRLGHSKIATTIDTYSHVTENIKNNTVDIFEKMMSKNKMPTS